MSHHSSKDDEGARHEMSKSIRDEMSKMMREKLGEYPDGKLNVDDEGALAMAVGHEKGVVKIMFPKPVAWIGLTPQQAADLAHDLIEHARACGHLPFVLRIS